MKPLPSFGKTFCPPPAMESKQPLSINIGMVNPEYRTDNGLVAIINQGLDPNGNMSTMMEEQMDTDVQRLPLDMTMKTNLQQPIMEEDKSPRLPAMTTDDAPQLTQLKPMSTLQLFNDYCGTVSDVDMSSWKRFEPKTWGTKEVLDFIFSLAGKYHTANIQGENFRNINGETLCSMTLDKLQKLEPEFGQTIYDELDSLKRGNLNACSDQFDLSYSLQLEELDKDSYEMYDLKGYMKPLQPAHHTPTFSETLDDSDVCVVPQLSGDVIDYEYEVNDKFDDVKDKFEVKDESGYDSASSLSSSFGGTTDSGLQTPLSQNASYAMVAPPRENHADIPAMVLQDTQDIPIIQSTPLSSLPGNMPTIKKELIDYTQVKDCPAKRRGRPPKRERITSDSSEGSDIWRPDPPPTKSNRGRKPGQLSKGNHLWEFIRDLLKDPQYNPHYIKWEDEQEGVFRIVKSKEVSQLWGKKKNNINMNYEKLSRAMRDYYKNGILDMQATRGKRLVYKFGKKARL